VCKAAQMGANVKNICFFSGDITRCGGTERVAVQIASALADMDEKYEITIISLMEAAESPFFDIPCNIHRHVLLPKPISPINRAILHFFPVLYRLIGFIRHNKIDIIIDVDGVLDVFSLPAKIFTKVKVISWEHFNFYADLGNKYRSYIKRLSARFADYIIVLTEEDKGYHEKELNLKCPIEFIYNPLHMGCDVSYNTDSRKIISVGRLNTQKGFDILIDAARIVFAKHKDWSWMIVGEGEEKEFLENKVKEYNLDKHIFFKGNTKNIEDYYKDAAIFVLTSRFEGFGLVITEAKLYRLPVVSFECKAGPKELIRNQHNGFLIPCFDIEMMANKINLLIENDQLRVRFSDNAYDDTAKFDYPAVLQKWEKIFHSL